MAKRRYLPDYVTAFTDRHGKTRFRFRRKGFAAGYFKAVLGSEEFRVEYAAFMRGGDRVPAAIERFAPGSINDLVTRYFSVPGRMGPTVSTQQKVRAILDRFRTEHGKLPVARVQFEHIDAIIAKRQVKVQVGSRMEGGVVAAMKLRKELVRLFDFAVKLRMRPDNPVRSADHVRIAPADRSLGYHAWSEIEIERYRQTHRLGTKPRLAMELLLWTGQRRGDAIKLGRQHIKSGRFNFSQGKTGKHLGIIVAPQLRAAIDAMPTHDHLCFLVTEQGKPFTPAGFGNWFRDQCDAAGLPHCSAHGLRKAIMRRMAELGQSNQMLKSVSGHTNDAEVAHYTRSADQMQMADAAIDALSTWEMSNPAKQVRHGTVAKD